MGFLPPPPSWKQYKALENQVKRLELKVNRLEALVERLEQNLEWNQNQRRAGYPGYD